MAAHDFPNGAPRCIHCSTLATQTLQTACPGPQGKLPEKLKPLPETRREAGVYDAEVISARIAELRAERDAALNKPADEEGGIQH